MQALAVVHVLGYLLAALPDGVPESIGILGVLALLLVEELAQDLLALQGAFLTEIGTQELAHEFHFRVHDLAVGANDVGRQYEQRENEGVALPLILPLAVLLVLPLLVLAVLLVLGTGVTAL